MDDSLNSSVVELEIELEWHCWSGYPRKPLLYWELAETEGPKSYTESAFPSLKPDIDIFGVPRRSRKQRGWYQVMVPSLGRTSERVGQRVHFRTLAKPSDIPPELFVGILKHLRRARDRHGLARSASVCRYWSVECQTTLFDYPGLKSREDALQLLEFMRTPASAVSAFVWRIAIRGAQAVSDTPWIHLVSIIGDLAHQNLVGYWIDLKGPLPVGQTMRSIHHRLPRSLPGHFSRHIERLSLTDIHFEELDDLVHLVWEMPDLVKLQCAQVTWGSLPTALPRRPPRNKSQHRKDIEMWQCGPRPVEASLWLAASVRRRNQAFFSLDDLNHVASLVGELEDRASASVETHLRSEDFFLLDLGKSRHVRFCDGGRDSLSSPREWCIESITLDARKHQHQDMEAKFEPDWTNVGRALSSFPALERMIVGFDSKKDMVRFEEEVAQVHLQRLSGRDMLRFALWDPIGVGKYDVEGTWLRASLNSNDTESSGCWESELYKV